MSTASDLSIQSDGEKQRREFEVNTVFDRNDRERHFCTNAIRTSRYTCLSFLPLNLFE